MVPKLAIIKERQKLSFRAVLFRMVPKQPPDNLDTAESFRAVLFRMVPKLIAEDNKVNKGFRAVLFRMVPKQALIN